LNLIGTIRTIRNLRRRRILNRGEGDGDFTRVSKGTRNPTTGQSYIQDLAKVELLTITDSLDTDIEPASAGVIGTVQVPPLAGWSIALRAKLEKSLRR